MTFLDAAANSDVKAPWSGGIVAKLKSHFMREGKGSVWEAVSTTPGWRERTVMGTLEVRSWDWRCRDQRMIASLEFPEGENMSE